MNLPRAAPLTDSEILELTEQFIRDRLAGDSSGHDWWHIDRVRRNALRIAREERANMFVVELAALLHDVADWKFHGGDESAGPQAARLWMDTMDVSKETVNQVCEIIACLSFKGAGVPTEMPTVEGKCVQDGDRLDAIGAIGIARAFAFGGHFGRDIHDPGVAPQQHQTFAEYKSKSGPTINHFYEKLLMLKDRMQTTTGRHLADERHKFMELYLEKFFSEWDGTS